MCVRERERMDKDIMARKHCNVLVIKKAIYKHITSLFFKPVLALWTVAARM